MKLKVESTVKIYEINGDEAPLIEGPTLKVHSHWNWDDRVVLELPSGYKYTILVRDLNKAVQNASNS